MNRSGQPRQSTGRTAAWASGGCSSSVPRFKPTSLTTKTFLWRLPEAWEDAEKQAFCQLRQAPPLRLWAPPAYTRGSKQARPEPAAKWVLTAAAGGPVLAAADLCITAGQFVHAELVVSECVAADGWRGAMAEALAFLVSGVIVMARADVVTLVPLKASTAADLQAFAADGHDGQGAWGERRDLWTPFGSETLGLDGRSAAGQTTTTLRIDPAAWWTLPHAGKAYQALTYIEKHRRLEERVLHPSAARRPQSLLLRFARMFRGR